MADADVFRDTSFLGLSRRSKRDPYRLGLFAQHLEPEEKALVLLAVQGGTLVVTDQRLLEFRAHLEVHGAWNVKEFQGYEVRRELRRSSVRALEHSTGPTARGPPEIEDAVTFVLEDRSETVVVSRGSQPTLPSEDFEALRTAVLGQPK